MNWIIENKEWLFSGIGITVITWLVTLIFRKKKSHNVTMNQTSGHSSVNIQTNGNITVQNSNNVKR